MRERVCLNGEWLFCPDYLGLTPEEATAFPVWEQKRISIPSSWRWIMKPGTPIQTYDLFGYPARWNDAESGVLSRVFTVKQRSGRRVFLIFQGILQRNVVFVNGAKAAESVEGFLPLEIDVTELVRHGDNELTIWCGPWERLNTQSEPKLLVPGGSWFAKLARGIWQDVYLEYRPEVYIADVYVSTSVRSETITMEADVAGGAPGEGIQIKARVWDNGEAVCELGGDSGHFDGEGAARLTTRKHWPDAIRWSPENPHLSRLTIEAIKDGAVIDRAETRFGFREVWLDGHRLYLNGIRINLRGDAWHYQGFVQQTKEYALNWYRACRENGFNFVRLHAMPYPEFYLDAADEFGMLIMDESAIYGSGKDIQADHPVYLENCRRHLQALVRRDRNHPSIINWSMQNEMRWVDGRDGYREAMPGLTAAMRELDATRPISYDGDNRLVAPEAQEIVSMHYNIDGTIAAWDRQKPLIFGEHGKWHYVAPQVCAGFGGPAVYLDLDACLRAIGGEEGHFLEYARREDVAGVLPFNFANYMNEALPQAEMPLHWDDPCAPGVKPAKIPRYSLTINNGLLPGEPLYTPNASLAELRPSLAPVTVIPDQYDRVFYAGTELCRTFSAYNETGREAEAEIIFRLTGSDWRILAEERECFRHAPGERKACSISLTMPPVTEAVELHLCWELKHGGETVARDGRAYRVEPRSLYTEPLPLAAGRQLAFLGAEADRRRLTTLLPELERWPEVVDWARTNPDLLIIGPGAGRPFFLQEGAEIDGYLNRGGAVLLLEQTDYAPGEVQLSGRRFFRAFRADPSHPVFRGLSDEDFPHWDGRNTNHLDCAPLSDNAFVKPTGGDLRLLLECGQGDFGWGGLCWTPLLEYGVGAGRAILNQVAIMEYLERVPQAARLLRNILAYLLEEPRRPAQAAGLIADEGSTAHGFLEGLGLASQTLRDGDDLRGLDLIVADPEALTANWTARLRTFAAAGGQVLILPAGSDRVGILGDLAGDGRLSLVEALAYQLEPVAHDLTRGLTLHDLYRFERVTYSPADRVNEPLVRYRLELPEGDTLFRGVHNHWPRFFLQGQDAEYIRAAAVALGRGEDRDAPGCYGLALELGEGRLVFSQILLADAKKTTRIYTRLLANMGAEIRTELFSRAKAEEDHAIPAFMALPHDARHSYEEMEAYFADPGYVLNNLGEGVYGWMRRMETNGGLTAVKESAGRTWFLTVFVDSALNRDPGQRAVGEMPDNSIVPDLVLWANRPVRLFVNGRRFQPAPEKENELVFEDVALQKGINRLLLVCLAGAEDLAFTAWFRSKHGGPAEGLRYPLTLD